jgi:hypothetical protein
MKWLSTILCHSAPSNQTSSTVSNPTKSLGACHLERSASKASSLYKSQAQSRKPVLSTVEGIPKMLRSLNTVSGSSHDRFWLTALRLESFQGRFLGRNSLHRHLLCEQLRDVSTPRPGLWEGSENRGAPLNMTGVNGIAFIQTVAGLAVRFPARRKSWQETTNVNP